jgi:hypothetical protein
VIFVVTDFVDPGRMLVVRNEHTERCGHGDGRGNEQTSLSAKAIRHVDVRGVGETRYL